MKEIRFLLFLAGFSLPVWLSFTWLVLGLRIGRDWITTDAFSAAVAFGGCGIFFTLIAGVGIRLLRAKRPSRQMLYTLGLLWVLVVSAAWWITTRFLWSIGDVEMAGADHTLLVQSWLRIPLVGLLFLMTYGLSKYCVALTNKWHREGEARRMSAFKMYPKALATADGFDILAVINSLDSLKQASKKSRTTGDKFLELLRYELSVSADPRYSLRMPLPIAVEFLRRELESRRDLGDRSVTIEIDSVPPFLEEMIVEPALLCALGVFAIEYGRHKTKSGLALRIVFKEAPVPCIEIQTNIKGGDLWFVLDSASAAYEARQHFIEALNRDAGNGSIFESECRSDGDLTLRITVQIGCEAEGVWQRVEEALGEGAQLLAPCQLSEGVTRVYLNGEVVHKVELLGRRSPKPLVLAEEYNILRRLEGIESVPRFPSYRKYDNFAVLSYSKIEGRPLNEYLDHYNFERRVWFRCIAELSALCNRIHKRGIVHRDLRPDNVLVLGDGRVCLIDFDQAVAGAYGAEAVDVRGEACNAIPPCISMGQLVDMLGIRDEYDGVVKELKSAWKIAAKSNASSPGKNIAYYRWVFGDAELPGEREWHDRWNMMYGPLRKVLPCARVLELGCNLGLLATSCMLSGAKHVTAVDIHADVLQAGSKLAKAADVDIEFLEGDLHSSVFINSILGREYDLVIALSVIHWLKNRDEVMRVLAVAPMVLFEGHDQTSIEIKMLRELGFRKVELLGYSERLRGLYLALK